MSDVATARKQLEIQVPLGESAASLFLPRDLTQAEADKLCALIQTLPIPTNQGMA